MTEIVIVLAGSLLVRQWELQILRFLLKILLKVITIFHQGLVVLLWNSFMEGHWRTSYSKIGKRNLLLELWFNLRWIFLEGEFWLRYAWSNNTWKLNHLLWLCRLSYLHSQKIVHRDVKAENMLLDSHRTLKIADFGVARVEAQNPQDMTGETGTLGYMAPEVWISIYISTDICC